MEEAASAAAVVHLQPTADLIEAVTDLRWLEQGHAPQPIDGDWWQAARAGSNELAVTWLASDQSGPRAGDVLTKEPRAEPMQCIAMPVQGARGAISLIDVTCLATSSPKLIAWIRRFGRA
jgi:hypothetical protein